MGDKGEASKLGASQPALVIGGVNPSGRKKRASFPPSARKLPPSQAAPTASNNNGGGGSGGAHESHGLSDAEKAKIHGKINGAKALEASEKMRAYLENKARKQREAMERRYGVSSRSENGASSFGLQREASSVTLGVGAEVKRAAAIAVEAGIRACTPESSAMLAQGWADGGLDGLMLGGGETSATNPASNRRGSVGGGGGGGAVEFARDGSADAGSIPRVSPPRVAGFGTAKRTRPPLSNRTTTGIRTTTTTTDGQQRLDVRRPAPLARPPSSRSGSDDGARSVEATPTGHKQTRAKHGPAAMTPSANDPLLDPGDVDSPGDFPSPAPSAAARYIGRPLGLHVTSPAAFGGMGSAESTPGLTPSEGVGGRGGSFGIGERAMEGGAVVGGAVGGSTTRGAAAASPELRRMRLPTLSDVEDAARERGGAGSGYDSPDDSFPDDARFGGDAGTDAADVIVRTPRSDRSLAASPRSEALRAEEEHRAAARIQAGARGHLCRARMDRELRARRLALAAREMEEVRAYDGDAEDVLNNVSVEVGDGADDDEAAVAAVAAAMHGSGGSIEALQTAVVDAVRGVERSGGATGGSSHLSADDTIARAADALTLSLTGSLPSSVGRTTGTRGGMNDDEDDDDGEGGFFDDDEGNDVAGDVSGDVDAASLAAEELATVAKMQASARDLLLSMVDDDAASKAAAAVSDGEAAAVAKMQASARLHLARS